MLNYNKMKTVELKALLDKNGIAHPVSKTGKFDRPMACDLLRSSESKADQHKRLTSEMVSVVFHNTSNEKGSFYASVNDYEYHIPREVEVELPRFVLDMIDDAEETIVYQVEEKGRFVNKTKSVRRHNYDILDTYFLGDEEDEAEVE